MICGVDLQITLHVEFHHLMVNLEHCIKNNSIPLICVHDVWIRMFLCYIKNACTLLKGA